LKTLRKSDAKADADSGDAKVRAKRDIDENKLNALAIYILSNDCTRRREREQQHEVLIKHSLLVERLHEERFHALRLVDRRLGANLKTTNVSVLDAVCNAYKSDVRCCM
jgi:hypothetical protein